MKMPTENQIKAGRKVASEMYDASIRKALGGDIGGCKEFDINDFEFKDIVMMYINQEIDSATGIFLAMNSVE